MRKLFVLTGGVSNDLLNGVFRFLRPLELPVEDVKGVLGELSPEKVKSIADKIEKEGFYQFERTLSEDFVERLSKLGSTKMCTPCGETKKQIFDNNSDYPRYDFDPNDLIGEDVVCELITDQTIKTVAGAYFKSKPVFDLMAMWWSLPSAHNHNKAAQMYHFDMDKLKFLKFFFYLTDVTLETGPHCFIKGSHKRLPWSLRRDGRFSDNQIVEHFGQASEVKFVGKKGTIIAVDTRGFHKGEIPSVGNRLIFQIEFANSLFGLSYEPIQIARVSSRSRAKLEADPATYLKIFE